MSQSHSDNKEKPLHTADEDVVSRHYDFIVDFMSPEFGLIDKLYAFRVITNLEMNTIEAEPVFQNKNKKLLEYVIKKGKCRKLFEALRKSDQSHLVNYLEANGS